MSITVGSNIASLRAQRLLGKSSEELGSSFEKLSSGLRINRASDDAAGLSIAQTLNTDARVLAQGIRNINDGISAISIAEGSLRELSSITMRQLELAEQAANGSYSLAQRRALHSEAIALTDEFNRIVSTTTFNGINLLSSSQNIGIQLGAGSNAVVNVAAGSGLSRTVGDGTFASTLSLNTTTGYTPYVRTADVNRDGILDLLMTDYSNGGSTGTSVDIYIGNGDGTFKASVTYQTGGTGPKEVEVEDVNNDGKVDLIVGNYTSGGVGVLLGNGDGTFGAPSVNSSSTGSGQVEIVDVNRDGKMDIVMQEWSGKFNVFMGNGNGTFQARVSYVNTGGLQIEAADFNEDGITDVLTLTQSLTSVILLVGNSDGSFKLGVSTTIQGVGNIEMQIADINSDGHMDFVSSSATTGLLNVGLGTGTGSFTVSTINNVSNARGVLLGDADGDGYTDIVSINNTGAIIETRFGNGDGSFRGPLTQSANISNPWMVAGGDFNRDGAMDLMLGAYGANPSLGIMLGNTRLVGTATHVSLITQADARTAIETLQSQLARITTELGNLGASQSRLNIAGNAVAVMRENYLAAGSRITDLDVAEETAKLVSGQIRQQAATSILASANQQPSIILKLLQ